MKIILLTAICTLAIIAIHTRLTKITWYYWLWLSLMFPIMYPLFAMKARFIETDKLNAFLVEMKSNEYLYNWFSIQWFGRMYMTMIIAEISRRNKTL